MTNICYVIVVKVFVIIVLHLEAAVQNFINILIS